MSIRLLTHNKTPLLPLSLFLLCTLLFTYSLHLTAHPEHKNTDIVLSDYGDLGKVDFSISCSAKAQEGMNTGLALLHHMMYAQAELVFSKQISENKDCAMLHWGYAMSLFHPLWPDTTGPETIIKGEQALKAALPLATTQREKDYINAANDFYKGGANTTKNERTANWAAAQKTVSEDNPNDIDARTFYALSLLATAPPTDATFSQQTQAGIILDQIFVSYPTHPGAIHYSIHAYDNPMLAKRAIKVARAYDKIAPDVPHALHMPSHIFVRLGMWPDVVKWNIRSAKAALKYPTEEATSMHYVHAIDYLIYGYLQASDTANANLTFTQMNAYHPVQQNFASAYALAAIPARLALEQHDWKAASTLSISYPDYFDWSKFPQLAAITIYAKALGAARINDVDAAKRNLEMLDALYLKTNAISPNYWAILVDAQRQTVMAWINLAQGNKAKAIELQRAAADLEDSLDKSPVTPAAVVPARELLGDMLLLTNQKDEARKAYQASLAINPNRLLSIKGLKVALQ